MRSSASRRHASTLTGPMVVPPAWPPATSGEGASIVGPTSVAPLPGGRTNAASGGAAGRRGVAHEGARVMVKGGRAARAELDGDDGAQEVENDAQPAPSGGGGQQGHLDPPAGRPELGDDVLEVGPVAHGRVQQHVGALFD